MSIPTGLTNGQSTTINGIVYTYSTVTNSLTRFGAAASTSTFVLTQSTPSTSVSTGALTLNGGLGVAGAVYAGSFVTASSLTAGTVSAGNVAVTGATAPTNGMYLKSSATSGLTFQNASHTTMQTYYGLAGLSSTGADSVSNNSTQFYAFGNDAGPAITGAGTYKTANIYNFGSGYNFMMTDIPAIMYIDGGSRGSNYSYTCPEANGALVIDITGMGGNAASGRNGIFVQNGASYFQTPSAGIKALSTAYASNNDSIWGYVRPNDPNGGGSPAAIRSTVDTSNSAYDNCSPWNLYLENATSDNYSKTNGGQAMLGFNDRRSGSTSRVFVQFFRNSNSNGVGSITGTNSGVSYTSASDYRLKNNPQPLTSSGAFIDALSPKTWTWTVDGRPGVGFIAHEVQAVSPSSVHGEKDAVIKDDQGNDVISPQSMEYGSAEFIANIVAELQSLRIRLAQTELEITQLKAG